VKRACDIDDHIFAGPHGIEIYRSWQGYRQAKVDVGLESQSPIKALFTMQSPADNALRCFLEDANTAKEHSKILFGQKLGFSWQITL